MAGSKGTRAGLKRVLALADPLFVSCTGLTTMVHDPFVLDGGVRHCQYGQNLASVEVLVSAIWMKITAFLLLFLMPATTMATNAVGLIHVFGVDATIDGRPCHTVDMGFDGERLATGVNSKATVTSRGTMVSVSSNTSVKLGTKALELIEGSVVVSSDAGTSTKVQNLTISTPPGVHAKFLAKRVNDELQLLALEGKVDLSDGQQSEPVPAVSGVKLKLPKDSNDSTSTGGKRWLTNDEIGILLVVAAGVAAGVALGIVNSQSSTPVTPP
jgi:hypothetical protein